METQEKLQANISKTNNDKNAFKRLTRLKDAIEASPYSVCAERALLITEYFKNKKNQNKSMVIQKAEAHAYMLKNKSVKIYKDELIVGSTTAKRVAGPIFPELHGLLVMEDLLKFTNRKVNPLEITNREKTDLITKVVPFWLTRFLVFKSFNALELLHFTFDQLKPKFFLINESAGIGHLVADYETLINEGLNGIKNKINKYSLKDENKNNQEQYIAMNLACDGVIAMAENYSKQARKMADLEQDENRKQELKLIAKNLQNVPAKAADTFYEAVQSIWMLHTALFLEGLDNGISFGRMDKYLYPFYKRDRESGILTREKAKEILACLAIKSCEIIPVFNSSLTENYGGFLSGQGLTIGGVDKNEDDITNELSFIFLELMDEFRMRQPNYHARIHENSPTEYIKKIVSNLTKGVNSPALFNDAVIIKSLESIGFSRDDAKEYTTLGCVEINSPGKSFGSTDAALVNLPICLEMALNQGKLFSENFMRHGKKTKDPSSFKTIEDLKQAYKEQLQFLIDRLVKTLSHIEKGNRKYHPTPLTSSVVQGCIESGQDITSGGAVYNLSGVQGVGLVDVGDSLNAIYEIVFMQNKYSLPELITALKSNFKNKEKMKLQLLNAGKFGNDNAKVDAFSSWVADTFYNSFNSKVNTRGGKFVAGFYSTTTHSGFGKLTGALPSGRMKGQSFTSGIAAMNGYDRKGPTASLNSIASIDYTRAHNGINVNAKFDTMTLRGEQGKIILESLLKTYFKKGGMQIQLNVLDSKMLEDAKNNPDKYPWLIVRVSGYSAYFNDLSPAMKDEIIQRSTLSC